MYDGSPKYMLYTGPSMYPVLKTGDKLHIIPYNKKKIRPGDVVVFPSPDKKNIVTHRVLSVKSGKITTRGDNNSQVDNYVLRCDDLIGRVIYAFRKRKRLRVYGGLLGRFSAMKVRAIRSSRLFLYPLLRPLYHGLARSGIPRKIIFPRIKTRIVAFRRPEGIEMKLLLGRRVIGQYVPGKAQWKIKPPFRLVVDVASLPQENQNAK